MKKTRPKAKKSAAHAPIFQGDLMLLRVDAIPDGATEYGSNVVAHSETGHHHVAEAAAVFTLGDARTLYLRALGKEPIRIVHKRSFDTHETIELPGDPSISWMVRRQREHTPAGWRMVMD